VVVKKIKVFEVDMLNAQNAEGATPLMMAAVMGNMPLVEVLLNNTKWV
jgi:ankyrin repeat protein